MKTFRQPLSAQEETKYIYLMQTGDEEERAYAKKCLIEHNLRLVAHIVKKYQGIGEDTEDLISIGCIGLIKAIDTFDAGKGRLATYACRCIDNELLMLLRSKKKSAKEVSLFEPIGQDKEGNEIQLLDVCVQEQPDPVDTMEIQRITTLLLQLIDICLSEREKKILTLRYGLGGGESMTQNDISKRMQISRSYVSRIEKRALMKLRRALEKEDIQSVR